MLKFKIIFSDQGLALLLTFKVTLEGYVLWLYFNVEVSC
jgi:hypothetical protein